MMRRLKAAISFVGWLAYQVAWYAVVITASVLWSIAVLFWLVSFL